MPAIHIPTLSLPTTKHRPTIFTNARCPQKVLPTVGGEHTRNDYIQLPTEKSTRQNMFFSLKKDSRTRGHEVKLVKDQCRLDIRKHSFSQRTINEWNKLSTDCVTASSVNMFKNKVDTYLRRAGYK